MAQLHDSDVLRQPKTRHSTTEDEAMPAVADVVSVPTVILATPKAPPRNAIFVASKLLQVINYPLIDPVSPQRFHLILYQQQLIYQMHSSVVFSAPQVITPLSNLK